MKQYTNVLLPVLTCCKNSRGLYFGPRTKILFPLRTTPLNTRAKVIKDPCSLPSEGMGLGVSLSTSCSSPARNRRIMSAQILSVSRSCWEREATRKTLLLAETERGNTKDRSILMKATFKAKSPRAEGWVFQLWQKSHPYHWGWGNYWEKLYLLALLPVDSFQGRLHLGWAPQVPGPAPLPTSPHAFILHVLASQQPPPEWKVYRTPQTC